MSREIIISVFKYNPRTPEVKPEFIDYKLTEDPGMTLFIALNKIRETIDDDLSFDFVCRAGICGSCAMVVNGKPRLACKTLTSEFKNGKIKLVPMPSFELIKDLSVNTGKWMDGMSKRVESWIHSSKEMNYNIMEDKVDPDVVQEVFELDRCIECGICVSGCGTKAMNENFVGAVGLNRVARFHLDPNDERSDEDFYELVGDEDGIFGCMTLLACEDNCPKDLPLQNRIAYMRKKMIEVGDK